MSRPNDLLIAYCKQDQEWLSLVTSRLDQQQGTGAINQWQDSEISPDQLWFEANKTTVRGTKVVVFLASHHFFHSEFNQKNDLTTFLTQVKLYDLTVLWLAVGPCPSNHPLSGFLCLNTNPAMPLSAFPDDGSGLGQEIIEIVDKINKAVADWSNARNAILDLLDGPLEENPAPEPHEESGTGANDAPSPVHGTVKMDTAQRDMAGDTFKAAFEQQQRRFDRSYTLLLYIGTNADLVKVSFQDRDEVILGRASDGATPDIDLTPYFDREYGVSRNHSRIHLTNNKLFITDLKSVNKTHVNGEALPSGIPRVLENGDMVRVGMMLVIVRFERPDPLA